MKDKHIIELLDNTRLTDIGQRELAEIREHAAVCLECGRALAAATISAQLLKEHASERFAPSPFFQTRVLAALRERQSASEGWALGRLWRATGALVSSMAATVATLAVLSLMVPSTQSLNNNVVSSLNDYSAEEVILNQNELPDDQISDGQVMNTLYDADEDTVK